jgi:phosphate ABC transporter phosphate-binding protein
MADTLEHQFGSPLFVGYRAVGSSTGQTEFLAGVTHFGCSEVPLSDAQRESSPEHLHLPAFVGTVSIFHSLPEHKFDTELKLDASLAARIFQGDITTWDHPDMLKMNPLLSGVPQGKAINVLHRTLGSSSTNYLSEYLDTSSEEWRLGVGKTLSWPSDTTAVHGSSGMVQALKDTSYSIGYADSFHGHEQGLKEAALKNKNGFFLTSSSADVSDAASLMDLPKPDESWAQVSLVNRPGINTWPITAVTYILVRKDLTELGETGALIRAFLEYTMSDEAIAMSDEFGFAPMPETAIRANLDAIKEIVTDKDVQPFLWEQTTAQAITGAGPRVFSKKRKRFNDIQLQDHDTKVDFLMKESTRLSDIVQELSGAPQTSELETCKGSCGQKSITGSCWCDDLCIKQTPVDCCADRTKICEAN